MFDRRHDGCAVVLESMSPQARRLYELVLKPTSTGVVDGLAELEESKLHNFISGVVDYARGGAANGEYPNVRPAVFAGLVKALEEAAERGNPLPKQTLYEMVEDSDFASQLSFVLSLATIDGYEEQVTAILRDATPEQRVALLTATHSITFRDHRDMDFSRVIEKTAGSAVLASALVGGHEQIVETICTQLTANPPTERDGEFVEALFTASVSNLLPIAMRGHLSLCEKLVSLLHQLEQFSPQQCKELADPLRERMETAEYPVVTLDQSPAFAAAVYLGSSHVNYVAKDRFPRMGPADTPPRFDPQALWDRVMARELSPEEFSQVLCQELSGFLASIGAQVSSPSSNPYIPDTRHIDGRSPISSIGTTSPEAIAQRLVSAESCIPDTAVTEFFSTFWGDNQRGAHEFLENAIAWVQSGHSNPAAAYSRYFGPEMIASAGLQPWPWTAKAASGLDFDVKPLSNLLNVPLPYLDDQSKKQWAHVLCTVPEAALLLPAHAALASALSSLDTSSEVSRELFMGLAVNALLETLGVREEIRTALSAQLVSNILRGSHNAIERPDPAIFCHTIALKACQPVGRDEQEAIAPYSVATAHRELLKGLTYLGCFCDAAFEKVFAGARGSGFDQITLWGNDREELHERAEIVVGILRALKKDGAVGVMVSHIFGVAMDPDIEEADFEPIQETLGALQLNEDTQGELSQALGQLRRFLEENGSLRLNEDFVPSSSSVEIDFAGGLSATGRHRINVENYPHVALDIEVVLGRRSSLRAEDAGGQLNSLLLD
ncbi:protein phosphatase CheZ [bacterium]|nr:protein phosphatase CheZ [bacterium]